MAASFDRATAAMKDLRMKRRGESGGAGGNVSSAPQEGGKFGDDVLDRDRFLRQFAVPQGSFESTKRRANQQMLAGRQLWDQEQLVKQAVPAKQDSVNPIDVQRLLLDRSKAASQQDIDRARLTIDQANLQNEQLGTKLNQQKYADEKNAEFINNFSMGEGAPNSELGALVVKLSDSTGGEIPPELMTGYLQAAVKEADIDWEDAPPKSLVALGKRAIELARLDNR
jgi:hypothetical protein